MVAPIRSRRAKYWAAAPVSTHWPGREVIEAIGIILRNKRVIQPGIGRQYSTFTATSRIGRERPIQITAAQEACYMSNRKLAQARLFLPCLRVRAPSGFPRSIASMGA